MTQFLRKQKSFLLWFLLTLVLGGYLAHIFLQADDKSLILPGKTTHGHYQIELACAECHTDEPRENFFTSSGVPNSACNNCHGEDLKTFSDSHPVRKFKNPENAVFLEHIDAMSCIACHREHDEKITQAMGVTIPTDYCAHCHEVTLENLESHKNLAYNSCATAGCHNYHDNIALAPSYLRKNYGTPDTLPDAKAAETSALVRWLEEGNQERSPLTAREADAPVTQQQDKAVIAEWEHTAHAQAGINCSDCHNDPKTSQWIPKPSHENCSSCHNTEVADFLKGKHGMRLAANLPAMTPAEARQPMKSSADHSSLSCSSCHQPHRYDRQFAAQQSCVRCHNDPHTLAYKDSAHARLWENELSGHGEPGTGVSCASCHLPREERNDSIVVNHNQNANLTPNEKMLRNVCTDCHGLQFAMNAITDPKLIENNFSSRPTQTHPGISWVVETAIKRGNEKIIAIHERLEGEKEHAQED